MRFINVVMKFKHEGAVFHQGEKRLVEDDDAEYFCKHGWAALEGEQPVAVQPGNVKLDVQNGGHKTKGEVK